MADLNLVLNVLDLYLKQHAKLQVDVSYGC